MTGRERGGGPIEMAIVFPLLLLFVFGVAHLSTYYLARQAALSVAQVAVAGERGYLAQPGAGQQRGENLLDQLPPVLQDAEIVVTNDGDRVTATVTGTPIGVIPWFSYTVSRTASGPVEQVP